MDQSDWNTAISQIFITNFLSKKYFHRLYQIILVFPSKLNSRNQNKINYFNH